jgi:hypothetical protein
MAGGTTLTSHSFLLRGKRNTLLLGAIFGLSINTFAQNYQLLRYLTLFTLSILLYGCPPDSPVVIGNSVSIARLAVYDFDVDIDIVPGEDTFTIFTRTDSTLIIQQTRTVDPDISISGDESNQTIYIVLPNTLTEFSFSDGDWAGLKTFAFTSERTVNEPVGRITGGTLTGNRLTIDNSWIINGTVTISEDFGPSFPLEMTGTFSSR